jgi:hypothetical protein
VLGNSGEFNQLHLSFPLFFAFIICVSDQEIYSASGNAVKTEVQPFLVKLLFSYRCKKPDFFWFTRVDFAVIQWFIAWLPDSLIAVADLKVNFFITFYLLVRNICHIQEARRTMMMIYLSLKKHKSLGHHYYIFSSVASLDHYMSV